MKFPRVSIITSIYKSEVFIKHFLEDVIRQSIFTDCEILLLNANSPENEEEIILKFQKFFPNNIVYKKLDKQYTAYETWNIGIDMARSEILTNWNTDDRRTFYSLETQVVDFENDPNLDVNFGPTLTTNVPNERTEDCKSTTGFGCYDITLEGLLANNSPHILPMWRKSIHERFGLFDTRYFCAADYEMWLRVLKNGGKFHKIDSLMGSYYRNPTGISSNPVNYEKSLKEVFAVRDIYRR